MIGPSKIGHVIEDRKLAPTGKYVRDLPRSIRDYNDANNSSVKLGDKCPARLISYPKINRGPVEFQEVVEGPRPVQEDVQEESVSSEEQVDIETEVYVQHVENMYISLK